MNTRVDRILPTLERENGVQFDGGRKRLFAPHESAMRTWLLLAAQWREVVRVILQLSERCQRTGKAGLL